MTICSFVSIEVHVENRNHVKCPRPVLHAGDALHPALCNGELVFRLHSVSVGDPLAFYFSQSNFFAAPVSKNLEFVQSVDFPDKL